MSATSYLGLTLQLETNFTKFKLSENNRDGIHLNKNYLIFNLLNLFSKLKFLIPEFASHRTRLLPIYTMFTSILSSKGMEISLHHSYTKIKRDILCHPISTYLSSQLSLQSSRKFVFDKFNVFILENYITDHQFGFLL